MDKITEIRIEEIFDEENESTLFLDILFTKMAS